MADCDCGAALTPFPERRALSIGTGPEKLPPLFGKGDVSAFLIRLGSPVDGEDRAFELATARLASRAVGAVRTGSVAAVRWAAVAQDEELVVTADRLTIADSAPFMIEPGSDLAPTGADIGVGAGPALLRRDRFGAKPLFFAPLGAGWIVASEAKLLTPFLPSVKINRVALSDAVNYRWVLGRDFLLDPITQVPAGADVVLRRGAAPDISFPRALTFEPEPAHEPIGAWRDRTEAALRAALRHAAQASGELAILVSGGVDSSVLAALARAERLPARGYVVRFEGFESPELERAREVARRLDLPVEEVVVGPVRLADRLSEMVWRLEQPPRHPNNVALEALFEMIRSRHGVVVHGEGAEMMFGLADHYRVGQFAFKRRIVAALLGRREWPGLRRRLEARGGAAVRMLRLLESSVAEFALRLDEIHYSPAARRALAPLSDHRVPCPDLRALIPGDAAPTHEQLQAYQAATFLQCSLVRLDRLASPLGLSVSLPFLSRDVVDVATHLPTRYKTIGRLGRPVLRDICDRYLPPHVSRWPKMGFVTPDRAWVLGPVSAWGTSLGATESWELARLVPAGLLRDALGIEDHELRWLLLTLELTLRHTADPTAVRPKA